MTNTTDFPSILKAELSEVVADVRSIEAYIQWRRPKLEAARQKVATLKALIATYEGAAHAG